MNSITENERVIFAAVDDIYFASKIRATAEHLGIPIRFVTSVKAVRELSDIQPAGFIADLQSGRIDVMELARELRKLDAFRNVRFTGFYSHVSQEIPPLAKEAGFDLVLPRSVFSKDLGKILTSQMTPDSAME